jgi:hypothetical protein
VKKRVDLSITEEVWKRFKTYCKYAGVSSQVEELIRKEVEEKAGIAFNEEFGRLWIQKKQVS